jgi:2-polyprenyl-3-methyl-5-hydroxy-6-metoxy-1,4-benzoquinol methylase
MIQITNCPVCGHAQNQSYLVCKDYTVSQESFSIHACCSCGFKFTNPIPGTDKLGGYYQSEDYISHSDTDKGVVSKLYKLVRSYTIGAKVKSINKLVSRGTILDYGCGTGAFLSACAADGWKTFGVEPDSGARNLAAKKMPNVFASKEELLGAHAGQKFDAISLWHVLEHVVDLNNTLELLSRALSQNGALIIALPNYRSYDAKYYREYWAAYDVPRHLYHFDKESISRLLMKHGFELKEVKPMLFDSFYVSLLSEKYKNGKGNLIKAFSIGLISNLSALFSKEHSSKVYVFKRA